MGNTNKPPGHGALELVDEAVHLLRLAPLRALAAYYLGSLPFVLGLLYFWADMSRSAFAEDRCGPASLGVGCLFLWMKFWHTIFARQLRVRLAGEPGGPLSPGSLASMALLQTIIQPLGLFAVPLALLITLPFGWVYAFFQNATVLGADVSGDLKTLFRKALRQAELWPAQNHLLLLVLSAFGIFVFLNVALGAITVPRLIKILLGVEMEFGKSWATILNTTFLATVTAVTYLCVDPVVKAVYVLRCFYGESLRSGEDLTVELKGCLSADKLVRAGLTILVFCVANNSATANAAPCGLEVWGVSSMNMKARPPVLDCASPLAFFPRWTERQRAGTVQNGGAPNSVSALPLALAASGLAMQVAPASQAQKQPAKNENAARPENPRRVSTVELDRQISDVINQREYSWRLPRPDKADDANQSHGWLARFLDGIVITVKSWAKKVGQWLSDLVEWLVKKLGRWFVGNRRGDGSNTDWLGVSRWLLFGLLAVVASVLAIAILRMWRRRRRPAGEVEAQPVAALPDLDDENIVADQLPEDDWLRMARELAEQGDFRSALRALFLASLAHLAQREMITLARFKSNREYERELQRRARARPEVQTAFAENVTIYDRVWYGLHETSREIVDQFTSNLERIKAS